MIGFFCPVDNRATETDHDWIPIPTGAKQTVKAAGVMSAYICPSSSKTTAIAILPFLSSFCPELVFRSVFDVHMLRRGETRRYVSKKVLINT